LDLGRGGVRRKEEEDTHASMQNESGVFVQEGLVVARVPDHAMRLPKAKKNWFKNQKKKSSG